MTIISINIKDILNGSTVDSVSFTLKNAAFTIESGALKVGDIKTVSLTAGIGTVSLSAGNYEVGAGSKKFEIGVTGTGTANLIDLVNITTPTPIQRGLPVGGATGYVLGKNSANDYDTGWLLSVITENNFTTALKNAYDVAVAWVGTNGANVINHLSNILNPHNVTKSQVGLGSVDNTSDVGKPVSTAQQAALDLKENLANKSTTMTSFTASNTVYLTAKAVFDWATGLFATISTAQTLTNKTSIAIGTATADDLLHVKGGNVTGIRTESTASCTVVDMYSTAGRTFSSRTNFNTPGFEFTRSTTTGGTPTNTVYHVDIFGNIKIGGLNAVEKLEVVGNIMTAGYKLSALNASPATASSVGVLGDIRFTSDHIYVCIAESTWKRTALTTF